jgi:UDP-glucose 4-epimerase
MNGNLVNIRQLLTCRNFKLINGDVRNYDLLEKNMRDIDVVFHLAAQIHVDRSIIEPKLTYEINVLGTQNILEAARILDIRRVVYASSSEVYGSAQFAPMDESHPLDSPHPYGASKIAADRACYAYIRTYGMDIVIMRPFNTYGPRQKDSGYGGAISIFVKRVLGGMPPIIYGDGQQTRDYTYIRDMVSSFDAVLEHTKPIREPINFGTGREVRIVDLANNIIGLCGEKKRLRPVHVEARPGEVQRLVAKTSRAKELLGWGPKYSLERGLGEFIDWYKNYKADEWTKPA